ncbi:hypothetical protein NQ314_013655 [Rhamnusium bicolor]|uniref:Tetratricopeptide SHNi-TPR domain-containing protein n=1 Tax=Rhamnusium bicolor TaxID=1586634 RepID=A0AAV8X5N1_9CUCU|nr:hypothetical protein NQ314_013655 [Rhamnusium bicolor]
MADVMVDTENKNPKELLGQGIKAYILQDYNTAVSALSTASEILVAEHGDDLHDSLGEVYLYYGKALLGLSREESEALGDAVPKNNDEESEEEDVENTETEEKENDDAKTNGKENSSEEKKEETPVETENGKEVEVGSSNGAGKEGEASGSGEAEEADDKDDKTDNDDEPTDLQVAWEVLELAKKIYQKHESENFEAAISDIQEGLEIQKELFTKDSRTVAETYYKLGIAYSTNTQIDEAIQSFKNSLQYLQNRIDLLEKVEDRKDEVEEEIKEIKNLIPDIEEKITDMKSYKDETLKKIMSAVTEPKASSGGASTSSNATSTKPATDISHLVKRKRKLDEIVEESEMEVEASPAKKPPA